MMTIGFWRAEKDDRGRFVSTLFVLNGAGGSWFLRMMGILLWAAATAFVFVPGSCA